MSWIRGRFEGTTIGEPVGRPSARGDARRYSLSLHSGKVHDPQPAPAPVDDGDGGDREFRQERVRRVELPTSFALAGAAGERTLFDVRIGDWRLEHPVEANGRSYATMVGTILARLVPPPEEPAALKTAPPLAEPAGRESEEPIASHESTLPPGQHEQTLAPEPAKMIAILKWSLALLFLALGTATIAYACGPETAGIWAAAVAAAMLVRAIARPAPVRTRALQLCLGGGALLLQVALLYGPLETAVRFGCRVPIREDLLWLAAPIAIASLLRSRWSLYATTLVWTGVLCTWCARLDGTCDSAAFVLPPPPAPLARARTDADGRWPADPPDLSGGAAALAAGRGARVGGGAAGGVTGPRSRDATGWIPGAGGGAIEGPRSGTSGSFDTGGADLAARPSGGAGGVGPGTDLQGASTGGAVGSRSAPGAPAAGPEAGGSSAFRSVRSSRQGSGGWVAPGHRQTERDLVLISLEHANRTPPAFFDSEGGRRVYLRTDPVFEHGSVNVSAGGALQLTRLAALLNLHPERRLALDVHTDAAGAPEAQLRLSERRATALLGWLVDRGHLDPAQIEASGVGGIRPIVPPDGSYAEQQPNRRIEVRLVD